MSTYAEQPFTEFEERYFLAEILKKSSLPPTTLLAIIRDARIEPAWNDIALPNGRSVSACQQAFQSLFSRAPLPPLQPSPLGPIDPSRGMKRPYSSLGDATTALPRELQPRPPAFASVNGQQVPIVQPQQAMMMSPVEPQRKKRGRPTKAEWERRQAEAQERGEVWPKPRKAKPRPSAESVERGKVATAEQTGAPSAESPSSKMEGVSVTATPTAAMSPADPQQALSQPAPSQQGQGYPPGTERGGPNQLPTPFKRPEGPSGPGGERLLELHQQQGQRTPSQAGQPGPVQPPYGYPARSQDEGGPVDTRSQPSHQQREGPPEQRR